MKSEMGPKSVCAHTRTPPKPSSSCSLAIALSRSLHRHEKLFLQQHQGGGHTKPPTPGAQWGSAPQKLWQNGELGIGQVSGTALRPESSSPPVSSTKKRMFSVVAGNVEARTDPDIWVQFPLLGKASVVGISNEWRGLQIPLAERWVGGWENPQQARGQGWGG